MSHKFYAFRLLPPPCLPTSEDSAPGHICLSSPPPISLQLPHAPSTPGLAHPCPRLTFLVIPIRRPCPLLVPTTDLASFPFHAILPGFPIPIPIPTTTPCRLLARLHPQRRGQRRGPRGMSCALRRHPNPTCPYLRSRRAVPGLSGRLPFLDLPLPLCCLHCFSLLYILPAQISTNPEISGD
jgi:hypothetical protein